MVTSWKSETTSFLLAVKYPPSEHITAEFETLAEPKKKIVFDSQDHFWFGREKVERLLLLFQEWRFICKLGIYGRSSEILDASSTSFCPTFDLIVPPP